MLLSERAQRTGGLFSWLQLLNSLYRKRLALLCWESMKDMLRRYLAEIGSKGGRSGTGKAKRRGSSAYYKALSRKAAKARAAKR